MPTKFLDQYFQINIDNGSGDGILGNQTLPRITTLSDGRFAVIYQDDFVGQVSDQDPIAAVFTPTGSTSNDFIRVNGITGHEIRPAVAALPGGGFGAVFIDDHHADGTADASPNDINYQQVNASGTPVNPALAIGDFSGATGSLGNPAIATLSTGRQVVVFDNAFSATDHDVYLNVVSANGLTTQFTASAPLAVDTSSPDWEANPDVAAIINTAMVVYEDGFGTTKSSANISARVFNGALNAVGSRITIADHGNELYFPKIAALDSHRYVVIYSDTIDVFGKIYDTTTSTLSSEFEVDQPGGFDDSPEVATTPDGGFIITWASSNGSDYDAVARRFNSDGVAMGQQFVVARSADGNQYAPAVSVSGANAMFAWTDNQARFSDTSPTSVAGQVMTLTTPPDFNNNGLSDMLWRGASGALILWDINGSGAIGGSRALTTGGPPAMPDASWSIVSEGDFNDDGCTDIVWRNTAGATVLWSMNGALINSSLQFASGGTPVNPDPSWSVAGSGDFAGSGRSELLWRNDASGELALWDLQGMSILSSSSITSGGMAVNPDPLWTIAGIGDLNGDTRADLIWRNTATGDLSVWLMNGSAIASSAGITSSGSAVKPDASWSVAAIGDFNADGSADMLWRNSDGTLALWLMNGAAITSSGQVMSGGNTINPTADWHIVETGDFNGDARTDILWRSDSGQMAEWLMNGSTIGSSVAPSFGGLVVTPDAGWSVQAKPTNFA